MLATLNGLYLDTEEENTLGEREQIEAKGSFHTLHTKRPWENLATHHYMETERSPCRTVETPSPLCRDSSAETPSSLCKGSTVEASSLGGDSKEPLTQLSAAGDRVLSCRVPAHTGDSLGQDPILPHQQRKTVAVMLNMDVRDIEDTKNLGELLQVLNLEEKEKGTDHHFPDIFMSDSDEEGEKH